MKLKIEKEKDNYFQDININDKTFKYKIFKYFYSLFQEKKEFNLFIKIFQIFIETIQFISYAFSSNHYNSWKLGISNISLISNILNAFRISTFLTYLNYKVYLSISYSLLIIIFILCLIVILNIIFIESTSKLYIFSLTIIRSLIDIISIIFYIPITEIILMPIKCVNGKVYGFEDGETCWEILHYINFIIGIIGAILLFIWSNFMLNFSFYPFQKSMSTIRITSNNDIIILIMKLFIIIQYLLISNEYISSVILLLISIVIFLSCYNESTYNNNKLEICIIIKNLLIVWSYLVLLISKLFLNVPANGFIYLLIFGYPIIIYLSIIIYNEKDFENINTLNIKNINDYVKKAKLNIKLINSYIEKNQNNNKNENKSKRYIMVLRGNIKVHNRFCSDKDCPLIKFINNEGNFNVQKQCLLNYMNNFFNNGLKLYPKNFNLLILFIYFNYSKRFNLNSARLNFIQLKSIECSIKNKYIIYCMEQKIKNINFNGNSNFENEKDNNMEMNLIEQKYQQLKKYIENSIKLYVEFWGIFSTNISSKINTTKLHTIGEKINLYLNEINNLWDNELKNQKLSNEYQNIIQLYSKFLLEVLWDQKKSKEVYKKLIEEDMDNYRQNDNKKNKEKQNNIEVVEDNQDFLLFGDFDEKGNCKIIQSSESFANFLGYKKIDIIGKSLKIIFPNILIEEHSKYLEENIKLFNDGKNNQNDLSLQENDSNKNAKLIIVKNRMGYIFPIYFSFKILNDNDYLDSFLIKFKFENKEPKSEYAYFILTNTENVIENISSSAINLGLSLDLLKKYIIKIDILLRIDNDKDLNIYI